MYMQRCRQVSQSGTWGVGLSIPKLLNYMLTLLVHMLVRGVVKVGHKMSGSWLNIFTPLM